MKPNKLTSGANVFWESSRMMIPQHKAASLLQDNQSMKQVRAELIEEEKIEMFGRLTAAKANTLEVTITVFGEYGMRNVTGIITGLDPRQQLIKIEVKHDWQLIEFKDVIGVELASSDY